MIKRMFASFLGAFLTPGLLVGLGVTLSGMVSTGQPPAPGSGNPVVMAAGMGGVADTQEQECDKDQVQRIVLVAEYATGTGLARVYEITVSGGCSHYHRRDISFGEDARGKTALELKQELIREGKGDLLNVFPGTEFAPEVLEQWRREGYNPRIEFASAARKPPTGGDSGPIEVLINGQRPGCEVAPQLRDNRVFLPFRCVAEALGGRVQWDDRERKVTVTKGGRTAVLWVGRREMVVHGRRIALDVAPYVVSGRTLVPVRALSEALGADVQWDPDNRRVLVNTQ